MKKENKPLAKVFHAEIQGKRSDKYEYLMNNTIASVQWQQLDYKAPYHFFVPKDFNEEKEYELGFKVDRLYKICNSGVESGKDDFIIKRNAEELMQLEVDIQNIGIIELSKKYEISIDKINQVIRDYANVRRTKILYRPFDIRETLLSPYSEGVFWRPRFSTMKNFLKPNIGLIAKRGFDELLSMPCFITKNITDRRGWSRPGMQGAESIFPLYLYPDAEKDGMYANAERTPNLNMEIVNKFAEGLGLEFVPEKLDTVGTGRDLSLQDGNSSVQTTFAPIDILDYIYAVLHSPTYRETYKEFLKIDFPRVPYPHSLGTGRDLSVQKFWKLVQLGGEIRQIHLLESPIVEDYITEYPEDGTNEVEKIKYVPNVGTVRDLSLQNGKVYINATQYFDNVPETAWNFYIGVYQPAQKWLKDRKGRVLNFDDILDYQKIIVALTETARLMKMVDEVMNTEAL